MQPVFKRNRPEPDLTACRVALCMVTMLANDKQIEACEATLCHMAATEAGLSAATFKRALDELRVFVQVVGADEEER